MLVTLSKSIFNRSIQSLVSLVRLNSRHFDEGFRKSFTFKKKREKIKLYPKIIYRLNVELEKDGIYAIRKQSNLRYA